MKEAVRILIIEDDPVDAELMVRELERAGFAPAWERVETEEEYLAALSRAPEVILSDSKLPLFDGLEALDLLQQRGIDIPFILVSGRVGEDFAVDAMKRGACDYLLKDRLARLGEAVRRAIEDRRLRKERAWAVDALRQSEERYRLISEVSSDYVYSLRVHKNCELECEWITDPFTRISGFTSAEINLRGWKSLYHSADLPVAEQHYETLLAGRADSIEARIVTKGQRARWIRIHDRPVGGAGGIERIYGAAQDITVQKQLEEQLLQTGKMEAIGQLAGGVAHDFNNLLTVIRGYGDLLKKRPELTHESREEVDEILEAARRASELTRQLLAFGRGQVLQLRNVNLNTIIGGIETLLRRLIGEDIDLAVARGDDLGVVKADPGQMEQVLMNLAVNARDAMPRGGKLTIKTSNVAIDQKNRARNRTLEVGEYVMLAISDNGVGMTEEVKAHLFEPFYTTKGLGKGTGLGLATCYGIICQSGGDIRVYSELNSGTTFKIYLPRTDASVEAIMNHDSERLPTGTESILVVEDDPSVRGLTVSILRNCGYDVQESTNAFEALIQLKRNPRFDLVITDVIMPQMSGKELHDQIKGQLPHIKVMLISGYTDDALAHHGVLDETLAFLEKPFSPAKLAKKTRDILDAAVPHKAVPERIAEASAGPTMRA